MHWRGIFSYTGAIIAAVGLLMIPALVCSLYYGDAGVTPLLFSMVSVSLGGGGPCTWLGANTPRKP
jgi:trk system potassium uptake protein